MDLMSSDIKDLMKALADAQKAMGGAASSSQNSFYKSKYADLASVWEACREPLTSNGLSVAQVVHLIGDKTCLVTILGHTSGQWIKSVFPLLLEKINPQEIGKCITYYRRYALSAMVGVYQEDDDAESQMRRESQPAKKPNEDHALTYHQITTIDALLDEIDDKEYLKKLSAHLKVDSLSKINQRDYKKTIESLQRKIDSREEANGSAGVA